jgi:hypothetical protein
MSTNEIESWAVDLKDVGAIYPFQGTEGILVFFGVVFWIGFHIIQARAESRELKDIEKNFDAKEAQKSIDRY